MTNNQISDGFRRKSIHYFLRGGGCTVFEDMFILVAIVVEEYEHRSLVDETDIQHRNETPEWYDIITS